MIDRTKNSSNRLNRCPAQPDSTPYDLKPESMTGNEPTDLLLIRMPRVLQMVGVSSRTLYRLIEFNGFPRSMHVRGCACWSSHDVQTWISRQLTHGTHARRRTPVRAIEIPAQVYEALCRMASEDETPGDVVVRLVGLTISFR